MSRPRSVGLPWYAPEDYQDLRAVLADGTTLPPVYETWRISAEQLEREVTRSGVEVIRVPIEPTAFPAWCAQQGKRSDGAARADYAAKVLAGEVDSPPTAADHPPR
jgi:hypothetical protein